MRVFTGQWLLMWLVQGSGGTVRVGRGGRSRRDWKRKTKWRWSLAHVSGGSGKRD